MEGLQGLKRSYTLVGEAVEKHQPDAIHGKRIWLRPKLLLREHASESRHQFASPLESDPDMPGLSGSVLRDGGTSDEKDSRFEASSQRPRFASVEPD